MCEFLFVWQKKHWIDFQPRISMDHVSVKFTKQNTDTTTVFEYFETEASAYSLITKANSSKNNNHPKIIRISCWCETFARLSNPPRRIKLLIRSNAKNQRSQLLEWNNRKYAVLYVMYSFVCVHGCGLDIKPTSKSIF